MKEPSPASVELAIVLPLGVVANQLTRIEADLRFLCMKVSADAVERDDGEPTGKVSAGLERINEALDRIRGLVADIEANLHAGSRNFDAERPSRKSSADRDD
jgi:hypothetical protein